MNIENSYLLYHSSMQLFKKEENLVQEDGIFAMSLMSLILTQPKRILQI